MVTSKVFEDKSKVMGSVALVMDVIIRFGVEEVEEEEEEVDGEFCLIS
jgi:hypothetical protein